MRRVNSRSHEDQGVTQLGVLLPVLPRSLPQAHMRWIWLRSSGSWARPGWMVGFTDRFRIGDFTSLRIETPGNFFDYIQMSLVSFDPAIRRQLATFDRNDERVLVKGTFMDNPSPQKHIQVSGISLVKKFEPAYPVPAYRYEAVIPDELLHISKADFLVHATVGGDGKIPGRRI